MYWNAPVIAHITDLPNIFTVEPQMFSLSANITDALALPTFQLMMSSPSQNTTEPLPIYHNSPSTNTTPQCYWATCFGINTSLEISLLCDVCHSFLDKKEPGEFSSWTYFRAIFLFLDTFQLLFWCWISQTMFKQVFKQDKMSFQWFSLLREDDVHICCSYERINYHSDHSVISTELQAAVMPRNLCHCRTEQK